MSPVAGDLAAEAKDQAESSTGFDTDTENARASLEKCPEKGGAGAPAHLEPLYSVIPRRQRALIVAIVSSAGLCSPLATSIYFPAMTSIATDLKVEVSQINLSITTYQIFQGLAPSFIGSFSDNNGRRPAFIVTFSIFLVANLALALQNSFPALLVLRCLQSAGSSATIALSDATVSDLCTRAERGTWLGYVYLGMSLGPALAPIIGGVLNQYLGWHSIFWFLFIYAGVIFAIMLLILPETGRAVVGNHTILPEKWNLSLVQWWRLKQERPFNGGEYFEEDKSTIQKPKRPVNPFSSLLLLFERVGGMLLAYNGILYTGYLMIISTLSVQLTERFGFNSLYVGLCFFPLAVGTLLSRFTTGKLLDLNFKRHARRLGQPIDLDRQQAIEIFPIEKIRLEISIPMVYISCGTVLAYAWTMQAEASLVVIEFSLFFLGLFFNGVQQGLSMLFVDTHQDAPATAAAANNLVRCLLSAGGTAVAPFMIERVGIGYVGVFISGAWFLFSPALWLIMLRGERWRKEAKRKEEALVEKENKVDGVELGMPR